jgi:SAM-dependent methyltransferase
MSDDRPSGGRWDSRYRSPEYFFGTDPNTFLVEVTDQLPRGRALFLGDGEGRNSVYLARQGWECTSVDASAEGNRKAAALAVRHGVSLATVHADLATYNLGRRSWDVIVSIFVHLPPELRADLHARSVAALREGGAMVLEAYTPEQLDHGTGGPPDPALMMNRDLLTADFAGLDLARCEELVRPVTEGRGHTGDAAVVQLLGFRRDARR